MEGIIRCLILALQLCSMICVLRGGSCVQAFKAVKLSQTLNKVQVALVLPRHWCAGITEYARSFILFQVPGDVTPSCSSFLYVSV